MALPKQSIRITDLTRLDTPEKIDAKQELLVPVASNQTEKDTFSMPLLTLVAWFLLKYGADKDLGNLSPKGQAILDAKQDYFDKNPENSDLNNFIEDGIYKVKADGSVEIHTPGSSTGYFIVSVDTDDDGTIEQQCRNLYQSPGNIYRRSRINNVWTEWSLITQDMYSPTFTEAPTVVNPGTNANQLATIGQLEAKLGDIFQTEYHITEGVLTKGSSSYESGAVRLQAGSRYITNDSVVVNLTQDAVLNLSTTGTHYVFGQVDGTLKSWTNYQKVVEVPSVTAPNTLYYNIMTDQYTDGVNIYSLSPIGTLDNGSWNPAQIIQFLNLSNLQATLDALKVQDKVDRFIGTQEQNSTVSSDTNYERSMTAGHYTEAADGSYDLQYGAGVEVHTHTSTVDDETEVKNVAARTYANDGANNSEIEVTPEKATLATPRQNGVPYEIATMKDIEDVQTTSLTFKGYVSTTAPSASQYRLLKDNLWINSATMPSTFPVPAANIKVWNGTAWVAATEDYEPAEFDFWRNVNDNEGYYWFAGEWKTMSTDMDTDDFQLNAAGKWELKANLALKGKPTAESDATDDAGLVRKGQMDNAISNATSGLAKDSDVVKLTGDQTVSGIKYFDDELNIQSKVQDVTTTPSSNIINILPFVDKNKVNIGSIQSWINSDGSIDIRLVANKIISGSMIYSVVKSILTADGKVYATAPTTPTGAISNEIATANWVRTLIQGGSGVPTGTVSAYAGSTPPAGYLICDGSAVSRTTYAALFAVIGTTYGAGDGNSTFNLPNWLDYGFVGAYGHLADTAVYNTGEAPTLVLGAWMGGNSDAVDRAFSIIPTSYSGNPAYTRNIFSVAQNQAVYMRARLINNVVNQGRYMPASKFVIKY